MARHAQILDHRGQPIRRDVLTQEVSGPTTAGVRSIWSAHPVRDLTPMRLARILREAEQPGHGASEAYVELAEVMEERDLHYLGTLRTRKQQVAQIGVTVEPASDAAEDVRDADLVREFFGRPDLEDEQVDLLDALGKSYSVAEIIWETSERQWMPQRLEWRLPQWFDFDATTGRRIVRRGDEGGWTELEPYKFVAHTAASKSGLPIRGGLARIAAWSWMFKSYTLRDWVRFVEAYGQPLRLGKYDKSSTPEDRAVLYRAVRDIGADMAAILPEEMVVEFPGESLMQGRSELYRDLVTYIDNQLSVAVLGQTLTTQPGESGSYALGQVHDRVRADIERSDGRQLAATLRRDIAIPMVRLNHGPRRRYPVLRIQRVPRPDLALLATALEKLVPLGLRVRSDQIRTWFDLDAPAEDDEVLRAAPPPTDIGQMHALAGAERALALARAGDPAQPSITRVQVERLRRDAMRHTDGMIGAIRERVGRGGDLRDVLRALGEMGALTADEPAATIGEALMAAELAGRYDVLDQDGDAQS